MVHFSIFGIPVSIQPFFWITMAFIGGALRANTPQAILELCLFILAGFISILVHELGHALSIKAYRVPTSITLQAFGGYATFPAGSLNRKQSFLVTAAGPAIQLALAAIAFGLLLAVPAIAQNPNLKEFTTTLVEISVVWAILNLLPVLPLDGGQLVNAVLGPARIKITLWITIITSVVIAAAAFHFTKSFLLPIFLAMFGFQAFQALREISSSKF